MVQMLCLTIIAILSAAVQGSGLQRRNADGTLQTFIGFDPDAVSIAEVGPVPEFRVLSEADLNSTVTEAAPAPISVAASRKLRSRIVGPTDDRVLWNNINFPYAAMGRVWWSVGAYCTATLIGSRLISIARHCTPSGGESWGSARFQPDYWEGSERLGGAWVTTIFFYPNNWDNLDQCSSCWMQDDWVIMLLDTRLGDSLGYLGVKPIDLSTQLNKAMFFNFGYPYDIGGGEHSYRQEGITVQNANDCSTTAPGPLVTDTDASPGQSGSPLWLLESGQRYQYGVLSCGSEGLDGQTIFGGGSTFVSTVVSLRQSYP